MIEIPVSNPGCVVRLMKKRYIPPCLIITILLVFVFALPGMSVAADSNWAAGIRSGGSWTDSRENFRQYEIFTAYRLPWRYHMCPAVLISTRMEGTAGVLTRAGKSGFVGSLGPDIAMEFLKGRVSLAGGASVAALSEHSFEDQNLGGWFQFISHVGANFRLTEHLGIGYRFQHMSNACIYDKNPGVDLHMLELRWGF
jgi:lipid A 3-O-deacylase